MSLFLYFKLFWEQFCSFIYFFNDTWTILTLTLLVGNICINFSFITAELWWSHWNTYKDHLENFFGILRLPSILHSIVGHRIFVARENWLFAHMDAFTYTLFFPPYGTSAAFLGIFHTFSCQLLFWLSTVWCSLFLFAAIVTVTGLKLVFLFLNNLYYFHFGWTVWYKWITVRVAEDSWDI